jgi:exopolysaccharide biosynthesis predicted pyruvyltransferase EpsI
VQKEFILLEETLRGIAGKKCVYYLANPGNWGDALIRYGTLKFLRERGFQYRELRLPRKTWLIPYMKGGTLLYGGGGGWCKLYSHSVRLVDRLRRRFKVIVLPSTYELSCSFPNTVFFCRDAYESKQNMPHATFCHDMAFSIGEISSPTGRGRGHFFRTDQESAKRIDIPPDNLDLSLKGRHWSDIHPFVEEVAKYSAIYTDRLHVAIAACLLGKEVHLYPGSYFKNRAVYMSSMKGCFHNVHFHENTTSDLTTIHSCDGVVRNR